MTSADGTKIGDKLFPYCPGRSTGHGSMVDAETDGSSGQPEGLNIRVND
ncbi:MAG: hypothetical protein ACYC2T_04385 [Bacillota bacterium]